MFPAKVPTDVNKKQWKYNAQGDMIDVGETAKQAENIKIEAYDMDNLYSNVTLVKNATIDVDANSKVFTKDGRPVQLDNTA